MHTAGGACCGVLVAVVLEGLPALLRHQVR
jgi:tetrahydromethanopterin S-methyltransferase subunit F